MAAEHEDWLAQQTRDLLDRGVPAPWARLAAAVGADEVFVEGPEERYNIAPTDWIPTLMVDGTLADTRWGVKRTKGGVAFNARAEELDSPFWAAAHHEARAVHVLSGFYEWRGGDRRDPVYVHRVDGKPLLMAALLNERVDGTDSATVTMSAPGWFESVHNRIPLLLEFEGAKKWMDGHPVDALEPLAESDLEIRPVQTLVNKVNNDSPALLRPRPTLF